MSKKSNVKELSYNYNTSLLGCSLPLDLTRFQSNKINQFLGCIRKVKNNKIKQIILHNQQHLNPSKFNQFKLDNPTLDNKLNPFKYIYPDQAYAYSKSLGMDFIGPLDKETYSQFYKNNKHYLERTPSELYRNSLKDILDGNKKYIDDMLNKNISFNNKRKSLQFIKKNKNVESLLVNKSDKMFFIKDNYIYFGKKFEKTYLIEQEIKSLNKLLSTKGYNKFSNLCDKENIIKLSNDINKLQLKLDKNLSYLGKLKLILPKINKTSKKIDFNSINSIRIKKNKNKYTVSFTYEYINEYKPCLVREDNGKEITSKEALALYIKELSDINPQLALDFLKNKVLGLDRGIIERLAANNPINSTNSNNNENKSHFISYSEELKFEIKKIKKQIKYHNKELKRRTLDSRGYNKSLNRFRKLNKKLGDVRKNENHQVSHRIIEDLSYPIIALERLNLKGMVKKAIPKINIEKTLKLKDNIKLNLTNVELNELVEKVNEYNKENKNNLKYSEIVGDYKIAYSKNRASAKSGLNEAMLNQNHGQLAEFLEYKSRMYGKIVIEVPAAYSSQECSQCGNICKENRVKTKFCCVKCGYEEHADINASYVIGKRVYESLIKYANEIISNEKTKIKINNKKKAKVNVVGNITLAEEEDINQ